MYRTFVSRVCSIRISSRLNIHLSSPKVEETASKNTQSKKSDESNDEVKFDYINKTGIVQLNKPKTLNALSLSMIEQIYPKMKVGTNEQLPFEIEFIRSILAMGIGWSNGISDYQKYYCQSILCWW